MAAKKSPRAATPAPPPPASTPTRLPKAKNLNDVIANFDTVIAWSIKEPSGIGYFAVMYKRATIAIDAAIKAKDFEHPAVMAEFAMIFAQRYFDALNAYLEPRDSEKPTQVWRCHFVGLEYPGPIIFQHLLTAVDAHINLDLGIAASLVGRGNMDGLRSDFDQVNRVLASQVQSVLVALGDLSPWIQRIRAVIPDETEISAINELLVVFRDLAWYFALTLADADGDAERVQALIDERDGWAAWLGTEYLAPPGAMGWLVRLIAREECRDVRAVIARLNQGADHPAPTNRKFLA